MVIQDPQEESDRPGPSNHVDNPERALRHASVEVRNSEKKRLEEIEILETVQQVGRSLAEDLDLQRLVQTLTDTTTALTGAQFGAFLSNDLPGGERSAPDAVSGDLREAFSHFSLVRNIFFLETVLKRREIVRLADLNKSPNYVQGQPVGGKQLPATSFFALPVVSRSGNVLGGLFFIHSQMGIFRPYHEQLATGIAEWAAVAIENARLYSKAQAEIAERRYSEEEQRQKREQAEESSRMRSEIVSHVSHDMRIPLNAILGYTDLILDGVYGPVVEKQKDPLERIQRNIDYLVKFINNVLDLSKIESSKVPLDLAPINIPLLVEEILADIKPFSDAKSLALDWQRDDRLPSIHSDPIKIKQILTNLLLNAVKFTYEGRIEITVTDRPEKEGIQISVKDTGIGIRKEDFSKIFESFYQPSETRKFGGSGLGLAIVKNLVKVLRGEIILQSEYTKGSTFTVFLPYLFENKDPGL